MTIKNIFWK